MQLFLMRHGEAGFDANSDKARVLTSDGIQQAQQMAQKLKQHVSSFDLVLLSPYIRVQQTWEQVKETFPATSDIKVLDELVPSSAPDRTALMINAYAEQIKASNVLVISHMPLLGYLVSELVSGTEPPLFATAGLALLNIQAEHAEHVWQQSPSLPAT